MTSVAAKRSTGLKFILSAIRSGFLIPDESIVDGREPELRKIFNAINDLKIKELKIAQNLFEDAYRKMKLKFEEFDSLSAENLKRYGKDVKEALTKARDSALAAKHSGLPSADQLNSSKMILAIEMLLVYNEATSKSELDDNDIQWVNLKLMEAMGNCNVHLNQANAIPEITDFIATKIKVEGYRSSWRLRQYDQTEQVCQLLDLNLQIGNFFNFLKNTCRTNSISSGTGDGAVVGARTDAGSLSVHPMGAAGPLTEANPPLLMGHNPLEITMKLIDQMEGNGSYDMQLLRIGIEYQSRRNTHECLRISECLLKDNMEMTKILLREIAAVAEMTNIVERSDAAKATDDRAVEMAIGLIHKMKGSSADASEIGFLTGNSPGEQIASVFLNEIGKIKKKHEFDEMAAIMSSTKSVLAGKMLESMEIAKQMEKFEPEIASIFLKSENYFFQRLEKIGLREIANMDNGGEVRASSRLSNSESEPENAFMSRSERWISSARDKDPFIEREFASSANPVVLAMKANSWYGPAKAKVIVREKEEDEWSTLLEMEEVSWTSSVGWKAWVLPNTGRKIKFFRVEPKWGNWGNGIDEIKLFESPSSPPLPLVDLLD